MGKEPKPVRKDDVNDPDLKCDKENTVENRCKASFLKMKGVRPAYQPSLIQEPSSGPRSYYFLRWYIALKLADLLGSLFKLEPPRAVHENGWGVERSNARKIHFNMVYDCHRCRKTSENDTIPPC